MLRKDFNRVGSSEIVLAPWSAGWDTSLWEAGSKTTILSFVGHFYHICVAYVCPSKNVSQDCHCLPIGKLKFLNLRSTTPIL